mmetsp:Transcript_30803/g.99303  ORF Transcript_30803/g.99303 Transcript_30803/m.99303 type:complete len:245 (-) Transcript_30803:2366-3100(-)
MMASSVDQGRRRRLLSAYVYFWSLHRLYETQGGTNQTLGWLRYEKLSVLALALLSSWTRCPLDVAVAMVVIFLFDVHKMPYIWDSEYWCMLTDLAFVYFHKEDSSFEAFVAAARKQMVLFYAAASFWKLNKDFFDLRASCAPIFAVQMIDFLRLPPSLGPFVAAASPAAVVLMEGAVAVALWRKPTFGVKLALVLHLLIAFAAPPNNVGTFSFMCASRLVLFVLEGFADLVALCLQKKKFFFDY